jgi:hypothetical protein
LSSFVRCRIDGTSTMRQHRFSAFLKPDGKADMHHDEGVRYNDLRRKIRMFVNIELSASSQGRWPELVARVEALGSEKTSLNREKPTAPSGPIYLLAKRR